MDLRRKIGLSAAGVDTMNNIIGKHVSMSQFCFSIIHLFIVLILDRAIKRGLFVRRSEMACSCYITRKTIYSVDKYESFWR